MFTKVSIKEALEELPQRFIGEGKYVDVVNLETDLGVSSSKVLIQIF